MSIEQGGGRSGPAVRRRAAGLTRAHLRRLAAVLAAATGLLAAAFAAAPAGAQAPSPGQERFTFFYKAPDLRAVPDLISVANIDTDARTKAPPVVGFLAALVSRHPGELDVLLPKTASPGTTRAIIYALQTGGQPAAAVARAEKAGWSAQEISGLKNIGTRPEAVPIATPSDLDFHWGASFATGDQRFVRPIWQAYAAVANRGDVVADDIVATARAMRDRTSGLRAIAERYGEKGFREIVLASAALWAMDSNMRQHAFIRAAVVELGRSHGNDPASRAFLTYVSK